MCFLIVPEPWFFPMDLSCNSVWETSSTVINWAHRWVPLMLGDSNFNYLLTMAVKWTSRAVRKQQGHAHDCILASLLKGVQTCSFVCLGVLACSIKALLCKGLGRKESDASPVNCPFVKTPGNKDKALVTYFIKAVVSLLLMGLPRWPNN